MPVERSIELDLNAYSLDSIKRAGYRFSDRFALDIKILGPIAFCVLIFDGSPNSDLIDRVLSAFRKELLDQDLRARIRAETEQTRNVILAHAFSRTGLVDDGPVQDN